VDYLKSTLADNGNPLYSENPHTPYSGDIYAISGVQVALYRKIPVVTSTLFFASSKKGGGLPAVLVTRFYKSPACKEATFSFVVSGALIFGRGQI
jgi:hypothetical protein